MRKIFTSFSKKLRFRVEETHKPENFLYRNLLTHMRPRGAYPIDPP